MISEKEEIRRKSWKGIICDYCIELKEFEKESKRVECQCGFTYYNRTDEDERRHCTSKKHTNWYKLYKISGKMKHKDYYTYSMSDLRKLISPYLNDPNQSGLQEVINILVKNNIVYCAMFGTLLGIMRNNKKIPWDKDYDLVIFNTTYKEVFDILTREKFNIRIHKTFIQIFHPCRVDLFLYDKTKNKAQFDPKIWPIFESDIHPMRDSLIDGVDIKIPNNSKKILDQVILLFRKLLF
jgi:hypothetical protein